MSRTATLGRENVRMPLLFSGLIVCSLGAALNIGVWLLNTWMSLLSSTAPSMTLLALQVYAVLISIIGAALVIPAGVDSLSRMVSQRSLRTVQS